MLAACLFRIAATATATRSATICQMDKRLRHALISASFPGHPSCLQTERPAYVGSGRILHATRPHPTSRHFTPLHLCQNLDMTLGRPLSHS